MLLNVICYYDSAAEAYGQPQYDDHEPNVIVSKIERSIKYALNTGSKDCNFLKTVTVMHLGKFNDETGYFDLFNEPVALIDCSKYWQYPNESHEN